MPRSAFKRLVTTPWFLVSIPEPNPGSLPRPRLDDLLESSSSDFPITIIETPPGFGKATALAAMANARKESTAWVTALAVYSDPVPLFAAILSSLHYLYPGNQGIHDEITRLNQDDDPLHSRIASVLSHLPEDRRTVVVINDAHYLSKKALTELVVPLARYSRGQLHFILSGMQSLTSWLAKETAEGIAHTIPHSEFLFTREEMTELATAAGLDPERIHAANRCMHEETHGWPVAVQLLIKSQYEATVDVETGTAPTLLTEYIVNEVLTSLPKRLQDFILTATASTGTSPKLVTHLTGDISSPALLQECQRRGLFLELLRDKDSDPRFRWHPLFAQSCQDILKERDPEHYDAMQRRTAEWMATRYPSVAITHALKVKDPDFAVHMIEDVWLQMITSDHTATLESLCLEVPTAGRKLPSLLYIRACCRDILGDAIGAKMLKARADRGIATLEGDEAERTRITKAFAELLLLENHSGQDAAVSTAEEILTTTQLHRSLFTHGTFITAWNCLKLSRAPRRAAALFGSVSASAEIAGFPLIGQSAKVGLITAEAFSGRFRVARHLLDEFDTDHKVSAPNSPVVGHVVAWPDAFMSFWQGDMNRAVQLVREIDSVDGYGVDETDLARLYFAYAAALSRDTSLLNEATIMVGKMDDEETHGMPWPIYKHVAEVCLHLARGDRTRAIALLEDVEEHSWAGTNRIIIAELWFRLGLPDRARRELDHVDDTSLVSFNLALYQKTLAAIDWVKGNKRRAHSRFESALDAAVPEGVLIPFIYLDDASRELMTTHSYSGTKHNDFLITRIAADATRSRKSTGVGALLSEREYEVFSFLATPMTAEQIAKNLFLSPATVRSHQASIYRKLRVTNRRDAVRQGLSL